MSDVVGPNGPNLTTPTVGDGVVVVDFAVGADRDRGILMTGSATASPGTNALFNNTPGDVTTARRPAVSNTDRPVGTGRP
ncbi:MAG: hypothetical protein LC745_11985 [Planctomycetia bacterium]|nr:hypothetical protein [Planctomycetia bacterium]